MDTPSSANKRSSKLVIITLLIAVGAILGLGILGFLAYQERNQTKSDISELQKSIEGIKDNDIKMQKNLDEIGKEVSAPESTDPLLVPEYGLTSVSTQKQPSNPYENTGKDFLFINISIKNISSQDGYIALSDIKFKDESDQTYSIHPGYPVSAYPEGLQPLSSQALRASETITGTLVYIVPHDTKKFVLSYDTASVVVPTQ